MRTSPIQRSDWQGVFAVPPLARRANQQRSLDWNESERIAQHIRQGGVTRLLYGGNAFLYHLTLAEYRGLLEWLSSLSDDLWCIPSAGPSYGRLMDQVDLLKQYRFPAVMHLPSGDPRDATGLERGLTEFAEAAATPLIVYLKEENNFGPDLDRGLDAVARLVDRGLCIGIKYAVVRPDPSIDPYLDKLLQRVPREIVISGIGERPAIAHLRDYHLPGFTTGSGCIGSAYTQQLFETLAAHNYQQAETIRERFIPLEDLRDAWGPARVLHAAVELAGIANTGPIPPFITPITDQQRHQLSQSLTPLSQPVTT